VPRQRAKGGRQHAVQAGERRQFVRLLDAHHPARQAETVLQLDAAFECRHIRVARQQEEVTHPLEIDLPARPLAERPPHLERAHRDSHVQLV
jgi:hypothetical protein